MGRIDTSKITSKYKLQSRLENEDPELMIDSFSEPLTSPPTGFRALRLAVQHASVLPQFSSTGRITAPKFRERANKVVRTKILEPRRVLQI